MNARPSPPPVIGAGPSYLGYVVVRYGWRGEQLAEVVEARLLGSQLMSARVLKWRTNSRRWTLRPTKIRPAEILRKATPADAKRFKL